MITPARIINIKKPIVPAVIQKEPISSIVDRSKYIEDFVYRIKMYIEDDLELSHLAHHIDIQIINTNDTKDYYVKTPINEVDDMYIIYINKYNIDKKLGIFGIDYYLRFICMIICMSMRTIFQYYNVYTCGVTMCEYIDINDLPNNENDLEVDLSGYCKDFLDRYEDIIKNRIQDTIENVSENINYFNMTRWIYYVVNTCNTFNELLENMHLNYCIAYQGLSLEKDQYYNLSSEWLYDTLMVEFNTNIKCNTIDEIIEYTKSLLIYSLCDIMNEVEISDSFPIDVDVLSLLISDKIDYDLRCLFVDYVKFGGR